MIHLKTPVVDEKQASVTRNKVKQSVSGGGGGVNQFYYKKKKEI